MNPDIIINNTPQNVEKTLKIMQRKFSVSKAQVAAIAPNFKAYKNEPQRLAQEVYNYLRGNFKYKLDTFGKEEIRLPKASIQDAKTGIDCEDFSILVVAIMSHIVEPQKLRYRIISWGYGWQHIYVIFETRKGDITIDPVNPRFNFEEQYVNRLDFPVQLSGVQAFFSLNGIPPYRWRSRRNDGIGRIGIDPVAARANGCFKESGNQYCRQPLIKPLIKGKHTKVAFAFDVVVDAQYVIMNADDLQPSHLGNVENPQHFLPEAQPRNRAMSQSGAEMPEKMARNLRPAEIVEGANAYTGAPIVNDRGEVIQGNGRAYALKFYWEELQKDPNGYFDYIKDNIDYLLGDKRRTNKLSRPNFEFIGSGLSSPAEIVFDRKVRIVNPVIVRMVKTSDIEAIKLGQYKQSDLEAISTQSNEIKSRVNLIDDAKLSRVLESVFAQINPEATLSETIRKSNLLSQLIRIGAIRADSIEEYTKNGVINARGVTYISDLLLNIIFKGADSNTPEIFTELPYKIQNSILKATPYLLRAESDKDIRKEVAKSIMATREFINSGYGNVKAWENSIPMFGDSIKANYLDFERKLVEIYSNARTQSEIVDYFRNYLESTTDQPADLILPFRPGMNKAAAIKKVFGVGETKNVKLELAKAKLKLKMKMLNIA